MSQRHADRERELQGRLEATLARALPEVEVLDVELDDARETVRVFIDTEAGVGFEECEAVTHAIRDECPDHALEVSSPGLERPLRYPQHFAQHVGEQVRLRRAGSHRAGVFELVRVDEPGTEGAGITVRPEGGEELVVPFADVVRCKLVAEDPFASSSSSAGSRKHRKGGRK